MSEGQGKFLDGTVVGGDLDTLLSLANAYAETPSGAPSEDVPLGVTALNAITVDLGPVDLLGDNGILQLGAVEQLAQADANGDAYAGSGAVSDSSGAIAIDDEPGDDLADASLDASSLLEGLDIDDLISEISLEVGALASRAEEVQGVVDSEYLIADLSLNLTSGLVEDLYGTLDELIGGLDTEALTDELNDIVAADLALDLADLVTVDVTAAVGVDLPALVDLLPAGYIGNTTGSVQVNLATGEIIVDIEQLLIDEGLDINGLDPNTPLLTGATLDALTTAVLSTVTEIVQSALDNVVDNIELNGSVTLDIAILAVPLASLVLNVSGPLSAPVVEADLGGVIGDLVDEILDALGIASIDVLETTIEGLLAAVLGGTAIEELETAIDGLLETLDIDVLEPVLDAIALVLGLTANVQPTSPPINAATGDLAGGSFTVRALQIALIPGAVGGPPSLATVDLASSTVRGTLAAVDDDTDVVDADDPDAIDDPDGADTVSDADTDTDVDVDSSDTDADSDDGVLASTGSTFDALWLAGLGVLALLAGAAMYLTRRRSLES